MTGMVRGSTQQIANNKLEEIKSKYISHVYWPLMKVQKDYFEVQNGDTWRALACSDPLRGYRCNVSYIDRLIPVKDIELIIDPVTTAAPFQAHSFYN